MEDLHLFDTDIKLAQQNDHLFKACVTGNWTVNKTANGGHVMALLANAMVQKSDKKASATVTANYISPSQVGEATVSTELFAKSRQFDRIQASLLQDGKEKVRAWGTFSGVPEGDMEKRYESPEPRVSPPDKCVRIPHIAGYSIFQHLDVRLDPSCSGWLSGELQEKSEQRGWIKFQEDRPHDLLSILLMADAFPPPVLASQGMVAWVPTIEFSVNIRTIPTCKWLKGLFRTRYINNGMLQEDGELWDESGELVAVSRQIALFKRS